jgi:60 kDa SS-A/Ro ribonucleoprotein
MTTITKGSRWSHRDLLRLAHPTAPSPEHDRVFAWITGHPVDGTLPDIITGYETVQRADNAAAVAAAVSTYRLPWEAVPSEFLSERVVWEALLPYLAVGATLRQLPRLTRLGLLASGPERAMVVARLTDAATLLRGRVHPLNILNALMAYRSGTARSGGDFAPVAQIVDALDAAFYASFGSVTPVGRPVRLALDVSGSMGWGVIAGTAITPAQATAALALVTAATEPDHEIVAFSHTLVPIAVSPRQRLDDVIKTIEAIPMGGTDCSQPMLDAMVKQREVDLFAIYTDNETWAGSVHPHIALRNYRDRMSRPQAGCVVVGMTATSFSLADPSDPRMLDVVGFDTGTPELISAFGRGEV